MPAATFTSIATNVNLRTRLHGMKDLKIALILIQNSRVGNSRIEAKVYRTRSATSNCFTAVFGLDFCKSSGLERPRLIELCTLRQTEYTPRYRPHSMKLTAFWNPTQCVLTEVDRRFSLHQIYLRNVSLLLKDNAIFFILARVRNGNLNLTFISSAHFLQFIFSLSTNKEPTHVIYVLSQCFSNCGSRRFARWSTGGFGRKKNCRKCQTLNE
jgi:hypothetical protein